VLFEQKQQHTFGSTGTLMMQISFGVQV